jgi:hypothetical protein
LITKRLWDEMSVPARAVLKKLMLFVADLELHAEKTRMNAKNLCLVFAPGIVRPSKELSALEMLRDQPLQQEALERMYVFVVKTFKNTPTTV